MRNSLKFNKVSSKMLNIFAIVALLVTNFYFPITINKAVAQAATPTVSEVSGTLSTGSTVTVTGANFGSKNHSGALLFDDISSIPGYQPYLQNNTIVPTKGCAVVNGNCEPNPQPTNSSLPWYNHWYGGTPRFYIGSSSRFTGHPAYKAMNLAGTVTTKGYFARDFALNTTEGWTNLDWWFRSNLSFGQGPGGYVSGKLLRLWHNPDAVDQLVVVDVPNPVLYADRGCTVHTNPDQKYFENYPLNEWNHLNVQVQVSATAGTQMILTVNGKYIATVTGFCGTDGIYDYIRMLGLDPSYPEYLDPNLEFLWGDIYFDDSLARVVIADSPTFNPAGNLTSVHYEMQNVQSWSNNSVSFKVNTGSFGNGQTAYLYVIDANGNVNQSGFPITIVSNVVTPAPDIQTPSAPSNLVASSISGTQINLSWTASTDNVAVTQYLVERSNNANSGFSQVVAVGTNAYNNISLYAGNTYYYRVRAQDAAGNFSSYSNIANATTGTNNPTPDTQTPSTPTNLIATATSTQINLSWTASTDNVGVSQYLVERSTSATSGFVQIADPSTNSYLNTGLTVGATYYYRVRARDLAGNFSGYSGTVSATIPSIVTPPSNTGNYSVWCSTLLGIVGAAMESGVYNRVADLNNDQKVNLSDLTLAQQYYNNNSDNSCQARFINTYTNDNYLNINWCAGIIRGLSDRYNSSTGLNNYFSLFDLNNDGAINLSDTAIVAQYNSSNNQAACFAEYSLPLNISTPSTQVITKLPSISTPAVDTNLIKKVETSKTELAKLKLLKGRFAQLTDGTSVYVTVGGKAITIDDNNITQTLAKQALGISKATLAKLAVSLNYNDLDNDGDQVPNAIEELIGTDQNNKDSDGDGYTDGVEIENYYSPTKNTSKARLDKVLAKRLAGRVLIVVPGGSLFYVNPTTYKLELLKNLTIEQLNGLGLIKEVKGIKIKR